LNVLCHYLTEPLYLAVGSMTFSSHLKYLIISSYEFIECGEQLLNQLDGAGPPPASKDQIDALPMTTIVQAQVGQLSLLLLHLINAAFYVIWEIV